jgi:histidinol phosphatase-like PHP family hydrolase
LPNHQPKQRVERRHRMHVRLFSINPDAHSVAELDLMRWGVAVARKGGVPKERVLNARTYAELHDRGYSSICATS